MSKRTPLIVKILLGLLALAVLAIALYFVPPIHSRLAWRLNNVRTSVIYFFHPPQDVTFNPNGQSLATPTPDQPVSTFTPEATGSPVSTPTNTPTSSPTLTGTPDPAKLFSSVNLSAQVISPGCEPKTVRFEVAPADPKTYSVLLFIRLHYKTAGDRTSWNDGFAMKPLNGKFIYDLRASSISDFNKFKDPVAWVQFQLVATDQSGAIIGRSDVFPDKLTISATCP